MAKWLIKLARAAVLSPEGWVHTTEIASKGGDYAKLKFWGLIEQKPHEDDPSKKDSGFWKPTSKGVEFVQARCNVPRVALVYNGKLIKFENDNETVSIIDCLGKKFDYRELMGTDYSGL